MTGQVLSSVADSGPSFVLKEISEAGVRIGGEALRLQLVWKSGEQPELLLTGKLACPVRWRRDTGEANQAKPAVLEVRRRLTLPPVLSGFAHEQVWMALAALGAGLDIATLQDWRRRTGRLVLPTRFAECKPAALNSFRRDVPVPGIKRWQFPDMKWMEGFDPSTLANVELVPATDEEAQQWVKWLLLESLNDYATPERLEGLAAAARQRFEFHNPSLPTLKEMLDQALAKPTDSQSRFVLAPYDLGLWS